MIDYVRRFYGYENPNMQQLKENYEDKVAPFLAPGFYHLDGGKYGESRSVFVNDGGEKYFVDKIVIDEGVRVTSKTFVSSQTQDGRFTEAVMHQYSAPTINEMRYTGQILGEEGCVIELSGEGAQSVFNKAASQFEMYRVANQTNQFQSATYFVGAQTEQ